MVVEHSNPTWEPVVSTWEMKKDQREKSRVRKLAPWPLSWTFPPADVKPTYIGEAVLVESLICLDNAKLPTTNAHPNVGTNLGF
jgi:hypothetical protein